MGKRASGLEVLKLKRQNEAVAQAVFTLTLLMLDFNTLMTLQEPKRLISLVPLQILGDGGSNKSQGVLCLYSQFAGLKTRSKCIACCAMG